jgi:hypothetical protein
MKELRKGKKEKAPAFREQAVKEAGARSMEEAMMTAHLKTHVSFHLLTMIENELGQSTS